MTSAEFSIEIELQNGENLNVTIEASGNVSADRLVSDVSIDDIYCQETNRNILKKELSVRELNRLMELAEDEILKEYELEEMNNVTNDDGFNALDGDSDWVNSFVQKTKFND